MARLPKLARSIAKALSAEQLLARGDRVVVGVSGGADSVALLHLLVELGRHGWQLTIRAAHFNHLLRGDASQADEAFVRELCERLGVPLTVERGDVRKLAAKNRQGLEEAGRETRYAFLHRVALTMQARAVAVGHHADDQAETVLYRICRGTGLAGLAGMPRQRPLFDLSDVQLVRPLLNVSRSAILEYLAQAGATFREDESNVESAPRRNRIRHELFPMIEERINPQVRARLLTLAGQAAAFGDMMRRTVVGAFESSLVRRDEQSIVLSVSALRQRHPVVRAELIREAHRQLTRAEGVVRAAHVDAGVELLESQHPCCRVDWPGGVSVQRRYGELIIARESTGETRVPAEPVRLQIPGRTYWSPFGTRIDCGLVEGEQLANWSTLVRPGVQVLDADRVRGTVSIRTRTDGDRMKPINSPGTRRVSDILMDAKCPASERDAVPIVVDDEGPIWIVGYRLADRVRIVAESRRGLVISVERPIA